jgi:hypothetical protein
MRARSPVDTICCDISNVSFDHVGHRYCAASFQISLAPHAQIIGDFVDQHCRGGAQIIVAYRFRSGRSSRSSYLTCQRRDVR